MIIFVDFFNLFFCFIFFMFRGVWAVVFFIFRVVGAAVGVTEMLVDFLELLLILAR